MQGCELGGGVKRTDRLSSNPNARKRTSSPDARTRLPLSARFTALCKRGGGRKKRSSLFHTVQQEKTRSAAGVRLLLGLFSSFAFRPSHSSAQQSTPRIFETAQLVNMTADRLSLSFRSWRILNSEGETKRVLFPVLVCSLEQMVGR